MKSSSTISGRCLCGAISITVESAPDVVDACHCNMCRKWSGGPQFAIDCGNSVSFEGTEHITVFQSSEWAERGFCAKCGTHLFYRLKKPNHYMMLPGIFDELADLKFIKEIFIDEKPDYYSFANDTEKMTGEQVFAQYGPSE